MASLWCPASGSPSFYSRSFTQFFLGRRKSTAQVKPLHQEGGDCVPSACPLVSSRGSLKRGLWVPTPAVCLRH